MADLRNQVASLMQPSSLMVRLENHCATGSKVEFMEKPRAFVPRRWSVSLSASASRTIVYVIKIKQVSF